MRWSLTTNAMSSLSMASVPQVRGVPLSFFKDFRPAIPHSNPNALPGASWATSGSYVCCTVPDSVALAQLSQAAGDGSVLLCSCADAEDKVLGCRIATQGGNSEFSKSFVVNGKVCRDVSLAVIEATTYSPEKRVVLCYTSMDSG